LNNLEKLLCCLEATVARQTTSQVQQRRQKEWKRQQGFAWGRGNGKENNTARARLAPRSLLFYTVLANKKGAEAPWH
jgi:hypothetical protein